MPLISPPRLVYVLYDGHCVTCHTAVRWLLRRRGRECFRFVPLEAVQGSPAVVQIEQALGHPLGDSVLLIANGHVYERSDAVLRMLAALPAPWRYGACLRHFPRAWRDGVYDWVARNRYRWFGTTEPERVCERLDEKTRGLLLAQLPPEVWSSI